MVGYIYAASYERSPNEFGMFEPSPNLDEVKAQCFRNVGRSGRIFIFRAKVGDMKPYLVSKNGGETWAAVEYEVFENNLYVGKTDDWKAMVKGLNSAMDVVDGMYSKIRVYDCNTNECVYEQEAGYP